MKINVQCNAARSYAESTAYNFLYWKAQEMNLKGKFYLNVVPFNNPKLFHCNYLDNFDISLNNQELKNYISEKIKDNHSGWDFTQAFETVKKSKFLFECDLIYVVNNKVRGIIEVHGPHHYLLYNGLSDVNQFVKTSINDFVKREYCKTFDISFFETKLIDGHQVNTEDLDYILSVLSYN